jgi:hypothetical protein
MITLEGLTEQTPKHARKHINKNVVDILNGLEGEHGEEVAENFKQNFISMSSILKSSMYKTTDYINAVKFVSFQLIGNSDIDSYHMTFPDRYKRLLEKYSDYGSEEEIRTKKISPFVTAYKGNDIVVQITTQAMIPPSIMNAPMFQTALNIQMDLAINAKSEMVRMQSADSILKHLKMSEVKKIELDIGIKGQDEIESLRNAMAELAYAQRTAIETKMNSPHEIASIKLVHEIIEVDDED